MDMYFSSYTIVAQQSSTIRAIKKKGDCRIFHEVKPQDSRVVCTIPSRQSGQLSRWRVPSHNVCMQPGSISSFYDWVNVSLTRKDAKVPVDPARPLRLYYVILLMHFGWVREAVMQPEKNIVDVRAIAKHEIFYSSSLSFFQPLVVGILLLCTAARYYFQRRKVLSS